MATAAVWFSIFLENALVRLWRSVAGFVVAERPDFIALKALRVEVGESAVLVLSDRFAQVQEQLENGVLGDSRNPTGCVDAHSLN